MQHAEAACRSRNLKWQLEATRNTDRTSPPLDYNNTAAGPPPFERPAAVKGRGRGRGAEVLYLGGGQAKARGRNGGKGLRSGAGGAWSSAREGVSTDSVVWPKGPSLSQ